MLKSILKNGFLFLGGDTLLRICNRVPRVFFWHGVDVRVNPHVEEEVLDIDLFQKQIQYLDRHFEIVSIEEFEKRLKLNSFSGKEVVLTFDDGYANNLHVVAPILSRNSLPFTVFVSTEHVETGQFFPTSVNRIICKGANLKHITIPSLSIERDITDMADKEIVCKEISASLKTLPIAKVRKIVDDLISNVSVTDWEELRERYSSVRPMNWDEVKLLSNAGATIGSHCMWHMCCHKNQTEEDVREQIEGSKSKIEKYLGKECRYFAYPNGDMTDYSNQIVKESYALGFSTKQYLQIKHNTDLAEIPRIGAVSSWDTFRIVSNLFPHK